MQISFVRTVGSPDRVYVHRSDGSEISWTFPTYGDQLPHDLVHLVVEAAFGVPDGFWGTVDAGADPARTNAQANQMGGADKYAGSPLGSRSVLLAEALANAYWSMPEISDAERLEEISRTCAGFDYPVPPSVTLERIAEVRGTLDRLREKWRTLVPKGAMKLSFDPTAPERSFTAIVAEADGARSR